MNFFFIAMLLISVSVCTTLWSQSPLPKQWDFRFGGNKSDFLRSVKQTTDGGYVFAGESQSGKTGDKTEDSRGDTDFWVVKTDGNGIKLWDKRFGGKDFEYCQSMQQTTDGGYILAGYSNSTISGDKTEGHWGGKDYWIVKINANGIKQWDKTFGGTNIDQCYAVQQTNDGGYILGGYSVSPVSGNKTATGIGSYDFWVVKTDANGVKQWDKAYGGFSSDVCTALEQTNDGGYILGGTSYSIAGGDKTEAGRGANDFWVVKIDANGVKQWDKTFGGNSYDYLLDLRQTSDGGYILGGHSESGIGGDKTAAARGKTDYWIIKIDGNGIKQWDNAFGGSNFDYLQSLQQTNDGGYILGGYSDSRIGGDKTEDIRGGLDFYPDYWLVKTDGIGSKLWDKTIGGHSYEYFGALEQTTDGGYIIGGASQSGISGDKTESNRGFDDYWVIKLGCPPSAKVLNEGSLDICVAGSVILEADSSYGVKYQWYKNGIKIAGAKSRMYTATEPGLYKVFVGINKDCRQLSSGVTVINSCGIKNVPVTVSPNPSKGIVRITYQSEFTENIKLLVVDQSGKLVFTNTAHVIPGVNQLQINLSSLLNGFYQLQIKTESGMLNNANLVIEK